MFCPNCGKPIPDGATVCPTCGAKIPSVEPVRGQQPTGNVPTNAYDSLGTSYQTPRTVVEGQEAKAASNAHNAHKNKVPTGAIVVLAVVVCMLLCSAFRESIPEPIRNVIPDIPGITQHSQTAQTTGLSGVGEGGSGLTAGTSGGTSADGTGTESSDSDNSTDGSSSSSSSSNSNSDSNTEKRNYSDLVGTWTGTLKGDPKCYGSQVNVPVLTINSIDDSGKVNFDVKLNFHDHDSQKNGSTDGDEMLEFKGLTASLKSFADKEEFTYKFDVTKYSESAQLSMTVSFNTTKDNRAMTTEVYSNMTDWYDDIYVMTK